MQTSELELMELLALVSETIGTGAPTQRDPYKFETNTDSNFSPPRDTLQRASITYTRLIAGESDFLSALDALWQSEENPEKRLALKEIRDFLSIQGDNLLGADGVNEARKDFVYPVV